MIVKKCSARGGFEAIPEKQINLNLNKLKSKYEVIADLPILILIKCGNYEVTCYKNGKLLIKKCTNDKDAEKIANEIYGNAK